MSTKAMIQLIADYFKTQPVLKAWIFGSFSRGEETSDSDVDILVRFDRTNSPIGLLAYMRMHRELEEKLGRKVDLVEEGTLRPAVQQTANRDIKVIYVELKQDIYHLWESWVIFYIWYLKQFFPEFFQRKLENPFLFRNLFIYLQLQSERKARHIGLELAFSYLIRNPGT